MLVSTTVMAHSGPGRRPTQRSQRICSQPSLVTASGTWDGSTACDRIQSANPRCRCRSSGGSCRASSRAERLRASASRRQTATSTASAEGAASTSPAAIGSPASSRWRPSSASSIARRTATSTCCCLHRMVGEAGMGPRCQSSTATKVESSSSVARMRAVVLPTPEAPVTSNNMVFSWDDGSRPCATARDAAVRAASDEEEELRHGRKASEPCPADSGAGRRQCRGDRPAPPRARTRPSPAPRSVR